MKFNSMENYHRLLEAGMPESQAEAIIVLWETNFSELATKDDLFPIKGDLFSIKEDLKVYATKSELSTALSNIRSDLIQWMVGINIASMAIVIGVVLGTN